jgi:hypothetical protein
MGTEATATKLSVAEATPCVHVQIIRHTAQTACRILLCFVPVCTA